VAYDAEISRANPTCFVFLIDQSASMEEPIGGNRRLVKSRAVADALNRLLSELAIKCAKEEGVRDYFHVAVIGYGETVRPALAGPLEGRDLIPLSAVASSPIRIETRPKNMPDGTGGAVTQQVKFPIWVDPKANGGTPMAGALTKAQEIVEGWLERHPDCFPPVVLNLTDGESTDGDPTIPAAFLQRMYSSNGDVLVFNLHVSSRVSPPITYPGTDAVLPNNFARTLFGMSSDLPEHMRTYVRQQGFAIAAGARGFVFNADVTSLVQFLDIGTRASDLR
jgi:hypothetical protein